MRVDGSLVPIASTSLILSAAIVAAGRSIRGEEVVTPQLVTAGVVIISRHCILQSDRPSIRCNIRLAYSSGNFPRIRCRNSRIRRRQRRRRRDMEQLRMIPVFMFLAGITLVYAGIHQPTTVEHHQK